MPPRLVNVVNAEVATPGLWLVELASRLTAFFTEWTGHAVENNTGDTKRERTKSLKRQRQSQKDQTER